MSKDKQGFTLIELLTSIAIVSFLLTLGVPVIQNFFIKYQAINEVRYFSLLINQTRAAAVMYRSRAQLCPLNNTNECHQNWNKSLTMFLDNNRNRTLDAGEKVLKYVDAVSQPDIKRQYPRKSIYFRPDGLAWGNNGSFKICYGTSIHYYMKIVISATGRIRLEPMLSGDKAKTQCDNI